MQINDYEYNFDTGTATMSVFFDDSPGFLNISAPIETNDGTTREEMRTLATESFKKTLRDVLNALE